MDISENRILANISELTVAYIIKPIMGHCIGICKLFVCYKQMKMKDAFISCKVYNNGIMGHCHEVC